MMDFDYVVSLNDYGVNVESGALLPKELQRKAKNGRVDQVTLGAYLDSLN